jgi:hypothetical protein
MVLAYDFYKSFWLLNPKLTKDVFLNIVGANNGYALNMFTRIHYSIFSELIDVENEYVKYYSFEYQTFDDYLFKKYNLDAKEIKKLNKKKNKFPFCKIYRKDDHSYGDYSIPQFITSETMYKRITKILKQEI